MSAPNYVHTNGTCYAGSKENTFFHLWINDDEVVNYRRPYALEQDNCFVSCNGQGVIIAYVYGNDVYTMGIELYNLRWFTLDFCGELLSVELVTNMDDTYTVKVYFSEDGQTLVSEKYNLLGCAIDAYNLAVDSIL